MLCLESNLAFECQHIIHSIQAAGVRKWVALQEGAANTLGWLTTNERKEQMCLQLREALSVGKLHFSDAFFSTTQGIREVKEQLEGELRNFCVLVEAAKTPFGKGVYQPVSPTCLYSLLTPASVSQSRKPTRARWAGATTTWSSHSSSRWRARASSTRRTGIGRSDRSTMRGCPFRDEMGAVGGWGGGWVCRTACCHP